MKTVEQLILESIGELETPKVASSNLSKEEVKQISNGLIKVASLPYKEEAYQSVCEIMKIASNSIESVMNELDKSETKIASLEKASQVRDIIDEMLDRGLITKENYQEKIAELILKDEKKLAIVKEAIKLASSNKNIFFENEKTASTAGVKEKSGMFDSVINV